MSLDFYESAAVPLGGWDQCDEHNGRLDDKCFHAVNNVAAAGESELDRWPWSTRDTTFLPKVAVANKRTVRSTLSSVRDWLRLGVES